MQQSTNAQSGLKLGEWKEMSKGGQGVLRLTLDHLHSLPPGCLKVFVKKREEVKTVWMILVYIQRNKAKKVKILLLPMFPMFHKGI